MLKLVLTMGDSPWTQGLMGEIAHRLPGRVVGVVLEEVLSWANLQAQLRSRIQRYPLLRVLDQILLQGYQALRGTELSRFPVGAGWSVPVHRAPTINDPSVIRFLEGTSPDIIINLATGLMRPEIFSLAQVCTLNLHPGIAPRYRGAGGNLWAIKEGALDQVGITVHKVDAGVDTGIILAQETIQVHPSRDSLESLTLRAVHAGVELIPTLIEHYEAEGRFPEVPRTGVEARTYGWPGLTDYLKARQVLAAARMAPPA